MRSLRSFLESKEKVEELNRAYAKEFPKLWKEASTTLTVPLHCGNFLSARCRAPSQTTATVTASHYENETAMLMNENRQKREAELTTLFRHLDATAISSAQLECLCWQLAAYRNDARGGGDDETSDRPPAYSGSDGSYASAAQEKAALARTFYGGGSALELAPLCTTGRTLFYRLCEHASRPEIFLFPLLASDFETCMRLLGGAFIRDEPSEQSNIMHIVLARNPLAVHITPWFTPHCLAPDALLRVYVELSHGMRSSSTTEALALLQRLNIAEAGGRLPPHQFSSLLPVVFENLAAVSVDNTALHRLCSEHFEKIRK